MIRIFREGGDIHLDTAMRAFGITDPKKVDKLLHRAPCKNVNFGIGYGLGAPGLLDLMALTYATAGLAIPDWLDLEWCEDFIQKWFGLYPMTAEYFALQHYRARRYRMVWTLAGRVRRVPEVASCLSRVHEAGLRQGGNMPIQGTAADLNKVGMGITDHSLEMLREAGVDVEALMSIHDELIVEVEDKWAEVVQPVVETSMAQCMNVWDAGECGGKVGRLGESLSRVPIKTDGHLMREWVKD
jgi:DNA polymerase-1